MSIWKLCSSLAIPMDAFIALRQLSGTDYCSQAQLLGYFDRFLVKAHLHPSRLTREITDRYQETLARLAPLSRANRMCVLKQFCEYLARTDALSYVPEPQSRSSMHTVHTPYIFSLSEVQALMKAASFLPPPGSLRPLTYVTLLGLLYSTGLRIGEARALTLESFHAGEQRLYIAAGKFHKSRWVALSESSCRALERYVERRMYQQPCAPDSPLFLNRRRRPLDHPSVLKTFHRLLQHIGMPCNGVGPRVHDLRHTFAVHRLLEWYRDGADVNARLPWLATYMGHVSIQSTQFYLHATPGLIEHVERRFHSFYMQNIHSFGGTQS
jgi:site-specific recombinase XerD